MFGFRTQQPEYRRAQRGRQLGDYLPWGLFEAPGILRSKAGDLQRTLELRPDDATVASPRVQVALHHQLQAALASLPHHYTLFLEVQRRPADIPSISRVPGRSCANLVDAIRQENARAQGRAWRTSYYLTLVYSPAPSASKRFFTRVADFFGGLFEGGEEQDASLDTVRAERREQLVAFERMTQAFANDIARLFASIEWLDDARTLTYLHSTISTHDQHVTPPGTPIFLDAVLADDTVELGLEGRLGARPMAVVSIKGYPSDTEPNLLDVFSKLPYPARLVHRVRFLGADQSVKALQAHENLFRSQIQRVNPLIDKNSDQAIDLEAAASAQDVADVLSLVRRGYHTFADHRCTLVLTAPDRKVLELRVEETSSLFRQLGFVVVNETVNLKPAWLSSLPGQLWSNPRSALISTRNLSHFIPTRGVWLGSPRNTHLDVPAHLTCWSAGQQPFFLNLNVGDVGHTLLLGPTGSGKSTALSSLILGFSKYPNAQVFIFDKRRSAKITTLCSQGTHLELSAARAAEVGIGFAPLARIHEPAEYAFALDWLEQLVSLEGYVVDAPVRGVLRTALDALCVMPEGMRTLSQFRLVLQHRELRDLFVPYLSGGQFGALWDRAQESLDLSDMVCFEMDDLIEHAPARQVSLVLTYLFHRLSERFDGRPTLLVLDEAWSFLDTPAFAARIKQWLLELRKARVYVVFATQNLSAVFESSIASTLMQACLTKIFLPNAQATSPELAKLYERAGLSASQITTIAHAVPKRDYYLTQPEGCRLFSLGLSPLELALVGASDPDVLAAIPELQARAARTGRSFLSVYLQARGFARYAQRLDGGEF